MKLDRLTFPGVLLLGGLVLACGPRPRQIFAVELAPAASPAPARHGSRHACGRLGRSRTRWDLNRITRAQLLRLPGMTSARAALILAARPYRSKRQLLQRHLCSRSEYADWKDDLVVHRAGPTKQRSRERAWPGLARAQR